MAANQQAPDIELLLDMLERRVQDYRRADRNYGRIISRSDLEILLSHIRSVQAERDDLRKVLEEELGHAHRLLDEQRWWLDRKSRDVVLLRRELAACLQALEFVEQNCPDLPGSAMRQTRIDKARVVLAKVSPES